MNFLPRHRRRVTTVLFRHQFDAGAHHDFVRFVGLVAVGLGELRLQVCRPPRSI
jgi:hypothetical protein